MKEIGDGTFSKPAARADEADHSPRGEENWMTTCRFQAIFRVQRHHERVADEFDHERKCHECHGNGGAGGLEMVVIPPMYLNFGDDKLIQIAC